MRFLYIAVAALFLAVATTDATAQELSRKEQRALEKEWKKKMKAMSPLDFKELMEDRERLQNEAYESSKAVTELESELEAKNSKIQDLESQLSEINRKKQEEMADTKAETAKMNAGTAPRNIKGLSYRVQIGAFRNKDLSRYTDNSNVFILDESDGLKKYTIGTFTDYWEADKFKVYLRAMGVKDAWVSAYKDGTRISMKEAREGAVN